MTDLQVFTQTNKNLRNLQVIVNMDKKMQCLPGVEPWKNESTENRT